MNLKAGIFIHTSNRILCAVAFLGMLCVDVHSEEPAIPIVDCHVHLWDISRPEGLGWIKHDDTILNRNFLAKDFEPVAAANGVKGGIVVQAGQSLPDNQWNLDITANNKNLFRGIVGNLSKVIGTPEFKPLFEKLCEDPRYVGYRLSGRYQSELTDAFFRDLELTAEKGKAVDILVNEYKFDDIAIIAKRVPSLRIMMNHFGAVVFDDPESVKKFKSVAEHKNVYCKVSSILARIKQEQVPQDIGSYTPLFDLAFESFGEDRLTFGSDWPVSNKKGDYSLMAKLTKAYFDKKGRIASEKLFYKNAVAFYRIADFN